MIVAVAMAGFPTRYPEPEEAVSTTVAFDSTVVSAVGAIVTSTGCCSGAKVTVPAVLVKVAPVGVVVAEGSGSAHAEAHRERRGVVTGAGKGVGQARRRVLEGRVGRNGH